MRRWHHAPDLPDASNVIYEKTKWYFAWGCFRHFGWPDTKASRGPRFHPLVPAEIGGNQPGIVNEVLGRSGLHDFAGFEDVAIVGRFERGARILFDQQDRYAE